MPDAVESNAKECRHAAGRRRLESAHSSGRPLARILRRRQNGDVSSRACHAISAHPLVGTAEAVGEDRYDYLFVDCPPSLGLLTLNALVAGDEMLIPIQAEYYALEGLSQLVQSINLVKARLNPRLAVGGVLLTMVDGRTRLSADVEAEVRKHFGKLVFTTTVPRSVRLAEAPSHGLPAIAYDRRSRGADAYWKVAMELVERA